MKHNSIIIQIWSSTAKHPQLRTIRYWSFACTSQVKVYLGSKVLFATDDIRCINFHLEIICFAVSQKINIIPSFRFTKKQSAKKLRISCWPSLRRCGTVTGAAPRTCAAAPSTARSRPEIPTRTMTGGPTFSRKRLKGRARTIVLTQTRLQTWRRVHNEG